MQLVVPKETRSGEKRVAAATATITATTTYIIITTTTSSTSSTTPLAHQYWLPVPGAFFWSWVVEAPTQITFARYDG